MIIKFKQIEIANINSVQQLETFIISKNLIKNFKNFKNIDNVALLDDIRLNETIGIKSLRWNIINKYIKTQSIWNTQYWIERGFSQSDAILNVQLKQQNNSLLSSQSLQNLKLTNEQEYKKQKNVFKEYWMDQGLTEKEAIDKVSKRQNTNSLEKFQKKYGSDEGLIKFNERNKKWIDSLYANKSSKEIEDFHKSKAVTKEKMIKKYGDIEGCAKWLSYVEAHSMMWKSSKIALVYINNLVEHFHFKEDNIFYGLNNKREYYIYNKISKKIYYYDFTIIDLKLIIEFNGGHVHPNNITDKSWKQAFTKKSYDECLKYDFDKTTTAIEAGFEVLVIKLGKNESIPNNDNLKNCINFIQNKINEKNKN